MSGATLKKGYFPNAAMKKKHMQQILGPVVDVLLTKQLMVVSVAMAVNEKSQCSGWRALAAGETVLWQEQNRLHPFRDAAGGCRHWRTSPSVNKFVCSWLTSFTDSNAVGAARE